MQPESDADHLNTPRLVSDDLQQARRRWDQAEPFGVNVPDENPYGLGDFEFNLRFPGQYADKETNLNYNYFRDYDPSLGIYKQSDPIGLLAGLNTYTYTLSSPVIETDLTGLDVTITYYPGAPGHLGIAINSSQTVGFYPVRHTVAMMTCSTVPGVVARDETLQMPKHQVNSSSIRIKTEPWQDVLMENYINRRQNAANPAYNLCVDQCHSFVDAALDAGGVWHPSSPDAFSLPGSYYDALQRVYGGKRRK